MLWRSAVSTGFGLVAASVLFQASGLFHTPRTVSLLAIYCACVLCLARMTELTLIAIQRRL
ncbi:MAG TPA: hypothetical protein VF457_06360 [Burkholderiaceae bacterium]